MTTIRPTSIVLAAFLACAALPSRGDPIRPPARHLILITLDGMRPAFYLDGKRAAASPTLSNMKERGAFAQGAKPAYPSLTYPGHANLSTGVRPHRHGIVSGTYFRPPERDGRGQWYAGDLKAPAIWDGAKAAGLTVAALSWPTCATSTNIDWNFPEFWSSMRGTEIRQVRKRATPEVLDLADELYGDAWPAMLHHSTKRDAFLVRLAEELILRHKPNLLLLHLVETDKTQHKYGLGAPQVRAALKHADEHIRRLRKAARDAGIARDTVFVVTGDHGFADVEHMLAPNALLSQNGLIRAEKGAVKEWTAMVENTGGSAGVYMKDPEDKAALRQVMKLFEQHAKGGDGRELYRLVGRNELDALGAAPDAAFYLESAPPYMFSGGLAGGLVKRSRLKGNHGYLPDRPDMQTGFVAWGPGIRPVDLGYIELVDVAPTVGRLLGFDMPDVEGRVLTELLD